MGVSSVGPPLPQQSNHALPALLGLETLIERRAIMDFTMMRLFFTGPGETDINPCPGTDEFDMLQAPSGHLMLPCCEYGPKNTRKNRAVDADKLVLHTSQSSEPAPETEVVEGSSASS